MAIPVELTVSAGRLPAAVEAAIYFICSEGLANIAKHAEATRVAMKLTESNGRVHVAIADDGVGGADASRGTGLRGLVDRVEALGGGISVESPPRGGTRLDATLPVDAAEGP